METKTRLLAPNEAAEALCMSTRRLLAMARDNKAPHVILPDGEIRFDAIDLRKWVEANKKPPATTAGGVATR